LPVPGVGLLGTDDVTGDATTVFAPVVGDGFVELRVVSFTGSSRPR
jgi:hypothetical protein